MEIVLTGRKILRMSDHLERSVAVAAPHRRRVFDKGCVGDVFGARLLFAAAARDLRGAAAGERGARRERGADSSTN